MYLMTDGGDMGLLLLLFSIYNYEKAENAGETNVLLYKCFILNKVYLKQKGFYYFVTFSIYTYYIHIWNSTNIFSNKLSQWTFNFNRRGIVHKNQQWVSRNNIRIWSWFSMGRNTNRSLFHYNLNSFRKN